MTSVPNLQLSTGADPIDIPQLGFGVISGLLLLVLAASVRIRMSRPHRHPPVQPA